MKSGRDFQRIILGALILGIAFLTYNLVLFAVFGFSDHGASFWTSYVFMLISFAVVSATGYMLNIRNIRIRDWLFGFPILKHSAIYIGTEFILSVLFVLLDQTKCPWWVSFVSQLILLSVHVVLIISCFHVHDTVVQIQTKVKTSTAFMTELRANAEMAAEKAVDPALKEALTNLSEQIRYSDPVSCEQLFVLEKRIEQKINEIKICSVQNDIPNALRYCAQAELLLIERNKKCMAMK